MSASLCTRFARSTSTGDVQRTCQPWQRGDAHVATPGPLSCPAWARIDISHAAGTQREADSRTLFHSTSFRQLRGSTRTTRAAPPPVMPSWSVRAADRGAGRVGGDSRGDHPRYPRRQDRPGPLRTAVAVSVRVKNSVRIAAWLSANLARLGLPNKTDISLQRTVCMAGNCHDARSSSRPRQSGRILSYVGPAALKATIVAIGHVKSRLAVDVHVSHTESNEFSGCS